MPPPTWPRQAWELLTAAEEERDATRRSAQAATAHRLRTAEREAGRWRDRAAIEAWKRKRLTQRRWWRLGLTLRAALRSPRALLLLPVTLVRLLVRPEPLAPEPELPTRPPDKAALALEKAQRAVVDGRYEEALVRVEEAQQLNPADPAGYDLERRIRTKLGDLTGTLETVRRWQTVADHPSVRVMLRQVEGRRRELDPRWLPDVGPPHEVVPVDGRVLHVVKESAPYLTNGYTMRTRYTLESQLAAGLDPVAVTSLCFPRRHGVDVIPAVEDVDNIRHHRLDVGPRYDVVQTPVDVVIQDTARLTARVGLAERPALVQAGSGFRGFETALVGLAVARKLGVPFVYEVRSALEQTWTGDLDRAEQGEVFERRCIQELRCCRAADLVLTIADSMRADLVARGVDADKIHIVPNGVDTKQFTPGPADRSLQRRLGLEGSVVVGYLSNLGKREGFDVLLDAVARLAPSRPTLRCLIVGSGPAGPELEQQAADLDILDRVVFTGAVPHEDAPAYYRLFDVFVIPRKEDRAARLVTPLKPFEAMATGRPMLVSDLPALREVVAPDSRGLSFRVDDPEDLARQLARLLDDEDLRQRLGTAARAWVEQERRWDLNGPRYVKAYGPLWERARARAS